MTSMKTDKSLMFIFAIVMLCYRDADGRKTMMMTGLMNTVKATRAHKMDKYAELGVIVQITHTQSPLIPSRYSILSFLVNLFSDGLVWSKSRMLLGLKGTMKRSSIEQMKFKGSAIRYLYDYAFGVKR